jgi:hypothetical protein
MSERKPTRRVIIGLGILLLIAALVYHYFADKQDVLDLIKQGEPAAARYESLNGDYPSYKLWDAEGKTLGYATIGDSSGYGGKLSVLTVVEENGRIKSINLLQNSETPSYLSRVLQSGIMEKIAEKNIQGNWAEVDGVSGATVTTKAILAAVIKSTAQIGNQQLGMNILVQNEINITWKDWIVLGLMLLAIAGIAFRIRKLRPWVLVLAVVAAFLNNYSLTYSNFVSLLTGKLPLFIERLVWYIMVPGILLITLIWGRNFYCSWMCPFGAVQEGVYKSLNLYEFSPSQRAKTKVARLRWPMLWLVAMLALLANNTGVTAYEPFSVFFDGSGITTQWIIMICVLIVCMAQMRFWCNSFCPVGSILNFTARLKRKTKKHNNATGEDPVFLSEFDRTAPSAAAQEEIRFGQCSNSGCPGQKEPLSKQDKLFLFLASVINILILVALLQNILLILD